MNGSVQRGVKSYSSLTSADVALLLDSARLSEAMYRREGRRDFELVYSSLVAKLGRIFGAMTATERQKDEVA